LEDAGFICLVVAVIDPVDERPSLLGKAEVDQRGD